MKQAIAQTEVDNLLGLIHHSDHGVQYTAWPYRELLRSVGIRSSMGAVGNCYENAMAERMNGILKNEYGLNDLFVDDNHAQTAVHEAIYLYNYERPHLPLDFAKPAHVHLGSCSDSLSLCEGFLSHLHRQQPVGLDLDSTRAKIGYP